MNKYKRFAEAHDGRGQTKQRRSTGGSALAYSISVDFLPLWKVFMPRLLFPRWVTISLYLSLAACSAGGAGKEGDDSGAIGRDRDAGGDAGGGGQDELDADLTGDGGQSTPDGSTGDGAVCKTVCDPDDCGEYVSGGCEGHLNCGASCPEGQGCGLVRPDKCDFPPTADCTPRDPMAACAGHCGRVPNGCSDGFIDCGPSNGGVTCASGQLCGGYDGNIQPNTCVELPVVVCVPETCASLYAKRPPARTALFECGTVSDGCGGTVDCAAEVGGCGAGEVCHFGDPKTDSLANSCVTPPVTCTAQAASVTCAGKCGTVLNNCNEPVNCAGIGVTCAAGQTCGGGSVPNVCGSGTPVCQPLSSSVVCADKCGFVSNGCPDGAGYTCTAQNGGISCDGNSGESCGKWGGQDNVCGKPACVPTKTQAQVCASVSGNKSCASGISDGCGGTINCGACPSDQVCGLTQADVCGTPITTCTPVAPGVACAGKCGVVSDGCGAGGSYTCNGSNGGLTCTAPEFCGSANGQTNKCVSPVVTCTPKTCAQLGHSCGSASDGCGIALNCWGGSCAPGDASCTGSCGDAAACISDATTGAQSCVVGTPSCTGSLCSTVPTTCSAASPSKLTGVVRTPGRLVSGSWINQLPVPNALIYIPANPATALPNIFEGVTPGNAASCGRCEDEKLVADDQSVLAAAVSNFKGEFTLEGRIPVGTAFKLVVKVGKWRRVVQVPAGVSAACGSRALILDYTRLAANSTDGLSGTHLPKIAISTGKVDEMECVFRSLGFADSEFTVPSRSGRVHMYRANGAKMAVPKCNGDWRPAGPGTTKVTCAANGNAGCIAKDNSNGYANSCSWSTTDGSVADSALFGTPTTLDNYDLVVWDCEGAEAFHGAPAPANVEAYVNAGGRMFASHFSYVWIENNGTLDASADWGTSGSADDGVGFISMPTGTTQRSGANLVKSPLFRSWLDWQGALTGSTAGTLTNPATPQVDIKDPRDRAGANVGDATDEWVYRKSGNNPRVQQLSFNTPYNANENAICGRVAYSGFHVADASDNSGQYFPGICADGELSAQEKILAFMLFDLATCVSAGDPPAPPSCTPKTVANTCPAANDACGYMADGCGGVVDCGGCSAGFYCDGVTCKQQQCTPATCSSLGFNCGQHADGCGGIARNSQGAEGCGTCTVGQTCGLGGPGLCGGSNCAPIPGNTACAGKNCGSVSNGCGGTYTCGNCTDPQVCGGAGTPNVCGNGTCSPIAKATACANKNCGSASDGCGGSYDCGTCVAPDTCGGGGQGNVCGHPVCAPYTQTQACQGKQCGWASDGCGGAIQCGACPNGGVCGGAGPNLCGSSCAPTSCTGKGAQCGAISDECGSTLNCGNCPAGQTCGAAGPNKCGSGPTCTPRTCTQAGAQCGLVGDGCNGVLDCGTCTQPGQTCGGAAVPNQCGAGTGGCNKLTCTGQNVQCGAASDGCGGLLDCGGCAAGSSCEQSMCKALPPILQ